MCLSDPSGDPRPYRAIKLLQDRGADIYVASFPTKKPLTVSGTFFISRPSSNVINKIQRKISSAIGLILGSITWVNKLNAQRYGFNQIKEQLHAQKFDLIIVEDLYLLSLAEEIKNGAKLIFDAREYYPEQSSDNLLWRYTERFNRIKICRHYLPKCDSILTVSPGLAGAYEKNFGVKCHLVLSVPKYQEALPTVPLDKIRMIHHGGAMRNRKLENMIGLFKFLDQRFELDFYLVGNDDYIRYLETIAKPYPQIRFRRPVEYTNIAEMLTHYDIGLYLLEPTGFNVLHALPNKFFEFIQARLMLAIGPSPDMAALVYQYNCGVVADTFTAKDLAMKLNQLTNKQIYTFKQASHEAAKQLCWEVESQKLTAIVDHLLGSRS